MKKLLFILSFTLTASILVGLADAGQPGVRDTVSREHMIKAAFVYNFAKFTQWPAEAFASPSAPLRLCVLRRDPFAPALDLVSGKNIDRRPIQIVRLTQVQAAAGCHVLFVSASEASRMPTIVRAIGERPVLTISDAPGFAQAGGIINLTKVGNNIRFEINRATAHNAGLRLSSQLLNLATAITSSPPGRQVAQAR